MIAAYGGSRGFPRIHCGVLALDESDASDGITGYTVPQSLISLDGEEPVLLDEVIGQNFAILSATDLTDEISQDHQGLLKKLALPFLYDHKAFARVANLTCYSNFVKR